MVSSLGHNRIQPRAGHLTFPKPEPGLLMTEACTSPALALLPEAVRVYHSALAVVASEGPLGQGITFYTGSVYRGICRVHGTPWGILPSAPR